jgi:hypothetical protein
MLVLVLTSAENIAQAQALAAFKAKIQRNWVMGVEGCDVPPVQVQ